MVMASPFCACDTHCCGTSEGEQLFVLSFPQHAATSKHGCTDRVELLHLPRR